MGKQADLSSQIQNQWIKDSIAGFVAGWVQVILTQPFQIIKTRLQYQSAIDPYYGGVWDCVKKTYFEEGLSTFYKGTTAPLVGVGFQISALFWSYEAGKRIFAPNRQNSKFSLTDPAFTQEKGSRYEEILPIRTIMLAGVFTSPFTSLISCPIEHARIRLQLQGQLERQSKHTHTHLSREQVLTGSKSIQRFTGSLNAMYQITKVYGILQLYRGFLSTLIRSAVGNIVYFGVYEYILRRIVTDYTKSKDAPVWSQSLAGSIAGVLSLLSIYQIDYVKTLYQSDELDITKRKYRGIWKTLRVIYEEKGGIPGLFKGGSVAFMRAALVHAVTFPAFEGLLNVMGRKEEKHHDTHPEAGLI